MVTTSSTPTFPLNATLLLPAEDAPELSADQVEAMLLERIPDVMVDREEGNRHVAEGLQRLIDMGTPEVVCRGHRTLFDRTLYVEFPVDGYPGTKLHGYTFGFSHYDGCIGLDCSPFDVEAIKAGALIFAERMGLALTLGVGDSEAIHLELWPGVLAAEEVAGQRLSGFARDAFQMRTVTNWPVDITAACQNWFQRHPEPRIQQAWITKRGLPAVSIPQLIERLQSIGELQACTAASRTAGYRDCVILNYPEWTGLLTLPGVPGSVFDD